MAHAGRLRTTLQRCSIAALLLLTAAALLAACGGDSQPAPAPEAATTAATAPASPTVTPDSTPTPTSAPTSAAATTTATAERATATATPFREEFNAADLQTAQNLERNFPKIDLSKRAVNLAEIRAVIPPDAIPAIDEPRFLSLEEASDWLSAESPVIAFERNGDVRAYPLEILTWHEIVNDVVGGEPVIVTYCPLCNSAIAFSRLVDGEERTFGVSGSLRRSDLIMYDRETETLWQQLTGEAIVGHHTGDATGVPARPTRLLRGVPGGLRGRPGAQPRDRPRPELRREPVPALRQHRQDVLPGRGVQRPTLRQRARAHPRDRG